MTVSKIFLYFYLSFIGKIFISSFFFVLQPVSTLGLGSFLADLGIINLFNRGSWFVLTSFFSLFKYREHSLDLVNNFLFSLRIYNLAITRKPKTKVFKIPSTR